MIVAGKASMSTYLRRSDTGTSHDNLQGSRWAAAGLRRQGASLQATATCVSTTGYAVAPPLVIGWFAHPTTHTTSMFLEALDDGTFALRDKPAGIAPETVVSILTHCVYWTRRVLDDLLTGTTYETWLDGIASSIQVMPRLPERRAPASRLVGAATCGGMTRVTPMARRTAAEMAVQ